LPTLSDADAASLDAASLQGEEHIRSQHLLMALVESPKLDPL
jgi:hypothetical protein